jgi:serine/threonine-protein kinase
MGDAAHASGGDPASGDSSETATVSIRPRKQPSSAPGASDPSARDVARASAEAGTPADARDEEPTRAATPVGSIASATDTAFAEVMLAEEAERTTGFALVAALVSAGVIAYLPFLGGDPLAKRLCAVGLLVNLTACTTAWWLAREPARYTRTVHRTFGWTLVGGILLVEHYFGFFSPIPAILALGIHHLGQSTDRSHSFAIPIAVMASYATGAALTVAGVFPDRGLFSAVGVAPSDRAFAIVATVSVMAMALKLARGARASMELAIRRSNEALRLAQNREAQLAEARQHLDRALQIVVGKPGRHTGEMAGKYQLGNIIGLGAMGEVYDGLDTGSGHRTAIKLMQPQAMERDDLVERFLREAEICRRIESEHVVRVYDVGRLGDGAPYMTMERLTGRDLAARLRKEGVLSLPALVSLARDVAEGLHHAHTQGVVHRDLKPLNVFESATEGGSTRWKILDFGISKVATSSGTLTREGIVGTPGYMSPEQARGGRVDHRSDLFAFGLVLYRAMTGRPPFAAPNLPQIMFDLVYRHPERPSTGLDHVPADVDLVFAVSLAKDADQRFSDAREMARAFADAARGELDERVRARGRRLQARHPWGRLHPDARPMEA